MNRSIKRIAVIFTLFFVALALNLTYLQVIDADRITAQQGNTRNIERELATRRGSILSADGVVLAESVKKGRFYERRYPAGALTSHITGFFSVKYGKTGLEAAYDKFLMAEDQYATPRDLLNDVLGKHPPGDDIVLTLDTRLQKVAAEALGSRRGAIVALDPKTGAVLAMASNPRYDPAAVSTRFEQLRTSKASPLLNRAAQGLYPPGSVFKILTAATALETGVTREEKVYDGPAVLYVQGGRVTNYGDQGFGTMRFSRAFAVSCNTIFAQVGLELGDDRLVEGAEAFGLNKWVPFSSLPTYRSRIQEPVDRLDLAWTAVGQGRTLVTPLQMALVGAGIANGGVINEPYVVKQVRDYRGAMVRQTTPLQWQRPLDPGTARQVRDLMVEVVEDGTGGRARIEGVRVAGKTGTAEPADKLRTHAWFVGFAPAEDPKIVVSVLVEHGGTGGRAAAPLAKQVMEAAVGLGLGDVP
ncbi:MAG: hypothetical protein C4521_08360 [Actinobacteria bacterium]|nr:MAG: hypothetical protein C4521_08360 [Actinomycetota bacterium]